MAEDVKSTQCTVLYCCAARAPRAATCLGAYSQVTLSVVPTMLSSYLGCVRHSQSSQIRLCDLLRMRGAYLRKPIWYRIQVSGRYLRSVSVAAMCACRWLTVSSMSSSAKAK